ncbi:MAG: hypothetical protein IPP88_21785 [Betaproteobacteria bacterium]|nr:hypothetical protein [Betaproteobacteria bacterium]
MSTLTDGMYKVIDTGNSQTSTFQKISNGLPIVEVRTHSSISTTDFTTMYAGTDGAGLFKTSDGGANWLPLNGSGGRRWAAQCLPALTSTRQHPARSSLARRAATTAVFTKASTMASPGAAWVTPPCRTMSPYPH